MSAEGEHTGTGAGAGGNTGANNGLHGFFDALLNGAFGADLNHLQDNLKMQPNLPIGFATFIKIFKCMEGMAGALNLSNVGLGSILSPPATPIGGGAKIAGLAAGGRGQG